MAKVVNSAVGSLSGTLSFDDGTNDSFHATFEYDTVSGRDLKWTFDSTTSVKVLKRLDDSAGKCVHLTQLLDDISGSSTPFAFSWAAAAGDGIGITDEVYHFSMLVTFTDGTEYPVSITTENVGGTITRTDHLAATDTLNAATNKTAAVDDKLEAALGLIMTATIT